MAPYTTTIKGSAAMNNLEIKGNKNVQKGRRKQEKAAQTGDRLGCVEGKEEELAGRLQKKFSKGEEEVLDAIDETDAENDLH